MKNKKIFIPAFLILLSLALAGCSGRKPESSESVTVSAEAETAPSLEGELAKAESIPEGDLTVPSYLKDEQTDGFSVVEENEDSVTYHLTKEERAEAVDRIAAQITDSINQVLADKDYYPHITGISVNEDCSEINVTFAGDGINIYETTLRMSLYIAGNRFQLFQGRSEDELFTVVNYIHEDTGELLSTGDSSGLQKE